MIEIFGLLIDFIWKVLSIQLTFDTYSFKIWHIMAFAVLLAVIVKAIFGSIKNSGNNGGGKEK